MQVVHGGTISERTLTLIPSVSVATMAVCLIRGHRPPAQVGGVFGISPTLQYSLAPTEPSAGGLCTLIITGADDFSANDVLSVRNESCVYGDEVWTCKRLRGHGRGRRGMARGT